jgi:hypothetical protein
VPLKRIICALPLSSTPRFHRESIPEIGQEYNSRQNRPLDLLSIGLVRQICWLAEATIGVSSRWWLGAHCDAIQSLVILAITHN